MNTETTRPSINTLTRAIIGGAHQVSNVLGSGFLEKVYENALVHELRRSGLDVHQQMPIEIHYDDIIAGQYVAGYYYSLSALVINRGYSASCASICGLL